METSEEEGLVATTNPTPFRINVPQATIDQIVSRVRDANWPDRLGNGSWDYGMSYDYLQEIVAYWLNQYNWRAAEAQLNRFPQFLARIEDFDIHFYHVGGKGPKPLPLLLTHGWPGSIFEFVHAIERFTDPAKFGDDPADAFTVVIPSLPGFGFSSKPKNGPIGPVTTARLWHKLMTEVLGYQRYGAQGGDLGCLVTTWLAHNHPEPLIGIHLNLVPSSPIPPEEMTEEEKSWVEASNAFVTRELDYFGLQVNKPTTPTFALADSPLGQAAWILEKFKHWSDSGDNIENAFTKDQLLTNLMLYLVSNTIDSSIWFYRGFAVETGGRTHPGKRIEVPTSVAQFPADMMNGRPPQSWVKRDYNLVHWTEMPHGGHFACLEQPDLFIADVRQSFCELR